MRTLERIEDFIAVVEKLIVTLALGITFIAIVLQVIVRYFDVSWIPNTSDLALVSVAVMAFTCIGLLTYTHGHISIELTDLMPSAKFRYATQSLAALGALAFVLLFGNQALSLLLFVLGNGEHTVQLHIPLAIPYASLVAGLVTCLIHTIMHWLRSSLGVSAGDDDQRPATTDNGAIQ